MKRLLPIEVTRTWKKPCLTTSDTDTDTDSTQCNYSQSDSVCSLQQQDTDLAKDTSDTSNLSAFSEFELANTSPEQQNPFFSTDDSDELNELNEIVELGAVAAAVSVNFSDVDLGLLADTSVAASTSPTSNSDADPELPRQDFLDFWVCSQCKSDNENRHVPFCSNCYSLRKSFFPPRPRRRKTPSNATPISRIVNEITASVDVVDGPTPTPSQSSSRTDSGIELSDNSTTRTSELCQICCAKPIDGIFAHGRTAHRYACYPCAKETWKRLRQCPLCRRKIDRVLRIL